MMATESPTGIPTADLAIRSCTFSIVNRNLLHW